MNLGCTKFFENESFKRSREEIEALGFTISSTPSSDTLPYSVIGGRSNPRWWLIPLCNRHVTVSGLAMFQPVSPVARLLKGAAVTAGRLGLSPFTATTTVHISGNSRLAAFFNEAAPHYAFFTGTDSPHRKAAVQIMDGSGAIRGFAKVSLNRAVIPLLQHEAETLDYLRSLDLKSAHIPRLTFHGTIGGADVLVTDTLKTPGASSPLNLNDAHIAFMRELAQKTGNSTGGASDFLKGLRHQYDAVAGHLIPEWQQRLEKSLGILTTNSWNLKGWGLCHGDFTPWNTFFVNGRLYVFDWEYARYNAPPGYDLIHFLFSLPKRKRRPIAETVARISKTLTELNFAGDDSSAWQLFLCYLCGHSLHYIGREMPRNNRVHAWDGERDQAEFMDLLLYGKTHWKWH